MVLTLLARAGFITADDLRSKRRYAIVLAFFVAAFLTPPDPISQIGMAIPTIMLYEGSIWVIAMMEKKRAAKDAQDSGGGGTSGDSERTAFLCSGGRSYRAKGERGAAGVL